MIFFLNLCLWNFLGGLKLFKSRVSLVVNDKNLYYILFKKTTASVKGSNQNKLVR